MSRLPLEQMMASLRPVASSSPKSGTIAGAVSVVMAEPLFSDAAVRFGQAGDVRELLGRFLREEREQLLGRDAADGGHAAQGRGLALFAVVLAEERDRLPMRVGQVDADSRREFLGQIGIPFVVRGQEALVVDVDLAAGNGGDGHGCLTPSRRARVCRPSTCGPAGGSGGPAAAGASTSSGTRACPSG